MIVIKMGGGLGNQMASYAQYVSLKHANPDQDFYIDTYIYDIDKRYENCSFWNGYELKKVFGIDIPDVRSLFSEEEVKKQIEYLDKSRFWETGNYSYVFTTMMREFGLDFSGGASGAQAKSVNFKEKIKEKIGKYIFMSSKTRLQYMIKNWIFHILDKNNNNGAFWISRLKGNRFFDTSLDFMKSKLLDKEVGDKVKEGLKFRTLDESDETNKWIDKVRTTNSVSIHVRRTDYLEYNEDCYKYGYFKKAVKYIKKRVDNPIFYIFSDDIGWCKNNIAFLGLKKLDNVVFMNSNSGEDSYKDMQIMANCKHNITTKSSFGWWASYLNDNPDKITICQRSMYLATKKM